ncbi:MAG: RNA 3'-terminal phosphate cyclase [Planctomycetales bacterium]|nr:RNA 3'-terminal phosphate cyclase [Planctomycetales bacterium]
MDGGLVELDGSQGEGGGQVLRTSLSLSLVTGRPVRLWNIRANREKPGLRQQHLTAVRAAAEIGRARVRGDEVGSRELLFEPGRVEPGEYRFAIGTAGSTTLVLQTVLPPLLTAAGATALVLEGGTHNVKAPPYDFVARSFLPLLERMGPAFKARLERYGFYPRGGGRLRIEVQPATQLGRLEILERGPVRALRARAVVAGLPKHIAERELDVVRRGLSGDGPERVEVRVEERPPDEGPGNAVTIEAEFERATEVFTGFGERNVRAEDVARGAVRETRRLLAAGVPVGEHLADQLLLPLALAPAGGAFRTLAPTLHATTNAEVILAFLPDVRIAFAEESKDVWRVEVGR